MDDQPSDPDETERLRREADADGIDIHQYRKRFRALRAIGLGAAAAGLVWLIMIMLDGRRNPCARVRDYLCGVAGAEAAAACQMYEGIVKESVEEPSGPMRQSIRSQCQTKIERLKSEEGVTVR